MELGDPLGSHGTLVYEGGSFKRALRGGCLQFFLRFFEIDHFKEILTIKMQSRQLQDV